MVLETLEHAQGRGAHILAELAGAASLAAALRLKDQLRGRRVALVLSGSNITPAQLTSLLVE